MGIFRLENISPNLDIIKSFEFENIISNLADIVNEINRNLIYTFQHISLNSDIIETGLINITILLIIVIYNGQKFLGTVLEERQKTIYESVKGAENRLFEAEKRMREVIKQLDQLDLVLSEIKNETIETKKILLESNMFDGKKDLTIRFDRAIATFQSKKQQLFIEIKQEITKLVLKQTLIRAQKTLLKKTKAGEKPKPTKRGEMLMNDTVDKFEKLKGDLR